MDYLPRIYWPVTHGAKLEGGVMKLPRPTRTVEARGATGGDGQHSMPEEGSETKNC